MNKLWMAVWLFVMSCFSVCFAQNPPLRVGVVSFEPPFVMQAANHFFGFDIGLMETICKELDRSCQYKVMYFDELLQAVNNEDVDVAVSSISITLPRAEKVLFSNSYYQSQARFLTRKSEVVLPFSLSQLNNKTIGVEQGSVLGQLANQMNIKEFSVETFINTNEGIDKLTDETFDYLLLDNQAAIFWQGQSSGILQVIGDPIDYGDGYGIAMKLNNTELQTSINLILDKYKKSEKYKEAIQRYFGTFN